MPDQISPRLPSNPERLVGATRPADLAARYRRFPSGSLDAPKAPTKRNTELSGAYSLAVPSSGDFKAMTDALCDALPAQAVVVGVEISSGSSYVTIWTTTPAEVIGSRGRMAESIREALERVAGKPIRFKVKLADGDIEGDGAESEGSDPGSASGTVLKRDLDPVPRPRVPRAD